MRYLYLILFCAFSFVAQAQIQVDNTLPDSSLAQFLVGTGVTISNATSTCDSNALGTYNATNSLFNLDVGVILSTGNISTAADTNDDNSAGTGLSFPGDSLLTTIAGTPTFDAAIFEFDIVPQGDSLHFDFMFGSEEYPEFVHAGFNDVFGFFISGPKPGGGNYSQQNIALIPGTTTPVSIDNVNDSLNSNFYVSNYDSVLPPTAYQLQYDGFTTGLFAEAGVIPNETYHLKLAIADAGDNIFDSGVFVERISSSTDSSGALPSGEVWPGDANISFEVDYDDILSIGLAYGATGAQRPSASLNWSGQPMFSWGQNLPLGVDYMHSDCNGDGVVDTLDALVVNQNFGFSHAKQSNAQQNGNRNDPPLFLTFNNDSLLAGEPLTITLNTGYVDSIHGLVCALQYDPALFPNGGWSIQSDNAWITSAGEFLLTQHRVDTTNGRIDLAFSRTDGINTSGSGVLGELSITIPNETVNALTPAAFTITDLKAITSTEADVPFFTQPDTVTLLPETTVGVQQTGATTLNLYPNPAGNRLNLQLQNTTDAEVRMYNMGGALVKQTTTSQSVLSLNTANLPGGVYVVEVVSEDTVIREKVLIH